MGARRIRREQRAHDQKQSRIRNGGRKEAERQRRAIRMKELIKAGKLPYIPAVMSWISEQLGKPSTRVTQEDVNALVRG
jgi:hypothetical protein